MDQKYKILYSDNSEPDSLFFLSEGKAIFYASEMDKYVINGKNIILGATEIVMNQMLDTQTKRIETAVVLNSSSVKRITIEKFLEGMKNYSFLLNTSYVLAKQVQLTNQIINKNIDVIDGDEKKNREASLEFYKIIEDVNRAYTKRKLPWIKAFVNQHNMSLIYKRGEAYFKSAEPTKVSTETCSSDNVTEYEKDTLICEENTVGNEMYILQKGTIDVSVGGNRVATISDQGTIIGEMALLLGEKRTATLKAKNNVVLTKISKSGLKEFAEQQGGIFLTVVQSLAKRHYYNLIKIQDINRRIIEQNLDDEESGGKKTQAHIKSENELRKMRYKLLELADEKKVDFLDKIANTP